MILLIVCPMGMEYNRAKKAFDCNYEIKCEEFTLSRKIINKHNIYIIKSGPGKVRAGIATAAGISQLNPDLVIDTGSCGSLKNTLPVGSIIISYCCYEYDISGDGIPLKKQKNMKIQSGFDKNIDKQVTCLYNNKNKIFIGIQACGEFIIKDIKHKMILNKLFNADACNWETAGVFIGALSRKIPCLSMRIITDLADENTFADFKNNIQQGLIDLYGFIDYCIHKDIFNKIIQFWKKENIEVYY